MLDKNLVDSVCCLNMGKKQCRYLSKVENSSDYVCLKKTKTKLLIDNIINELKNAPENSPLGDNCKGLDSFN